MIHGKLWRVMLLGSTAIGLAAMAGSLVIGPALVQLTGESAARVVIVALVCLARFAWARAAARWLAERGWSLTGACLTVLTAAALGWLITVLPFALLGGWGLGPSALTFVPAFSDVPAAQLALRLGIDLCLVIAVSFAGILTGRTAGDATVPTASGAGTRAPTASGAGTRVRTASGAGNLGPRLGP